MNRRDREQLRASIARDLEEGQGEHSPTKELLKQYAPLKGIVPSRRAVISPPAERGTPVEKPLAPHATEASKQHSAWNGATEAPPATVAPAATMERLAVVKGELRVPNTINFSLFPTLDPFAKAVYYQLFLLSHGFRRDTCVVGFAKLAKSVLMSQRKVQDTITYLEKKGLIRRLRAVLGGPLKGNVYQVPIPAADTAPGSSVTGGAEVAHDAAMARHASVAAEASAMPDATNKDDDDYKKQSSSKGRHPFADAKKHVENHSVAAMPRERQEISDRDFALVRTTYEKATGNRWSKSDSETYTEHGLNQVPVDKIISVLEAVTRRTPTKINSFRYFVKEIGALRDPHNRARQKKQNEKIDERIRFNSVGRAGYSDIDFLEDVKYACALAHRPCHSQKHRPRHN
jgi:hypothetical protein